MLGANVPLQVLRDILGSGLIIRVVSSTAGRVSAEASTPDLLAHAAAAVATVRRSWNWDESPHISITFDGQHEFVIDPSFENGRWVVEMSPN